jgi:WD40 repeat protein
LQFYLHRNYQFLLNKSSGAEEEKKIEMTRLFLGHTDWVRSVAFSPDGETLASGSDDTTVRIWNAKTGALLRTLREKHSKSVLSVAFAPDGKTLAAGSLVCTLWNVANGHCIRILDGHSEMVTSVAFSLDGKMLASASVDETVCVWMVASGKRTNTLRGHSKPVRSVAFSPKIPNTLASGSADGMRIWELTYGGITTCADVFTDQPNAGIRSVAYSPDGNLLSMGSTWGMIQFWSFESSEKFSNEAFHHDDWVQCVAFSPNGRMLVSASDDGSVRLWDVKLGEINTMLHEWLTHAVFAAFSRNGKALATACKDGAVRVFSLLNYDVLCRGSLLLRVGVAPYVVFDVVNYCMQRSFDAESKHMQFEKISFLEQMQARNRIK